MKTAIVALGAVLLAGAAGAQTSDHAVAIAGFTYIPGQDGVAGQARGVLPVTLTIREGDSVTATNIDPVPHTITSGNPGAGAGADFETGNVTIGQSREAVGVEDLPPGEYEFHCRIHPAVMFGVLRVEPAGTVSGGD